MLRSNLEHLNLKLDKIRINCRSCGKASHKAKTKKGSSSKKKVFSQKSKKKAAKVVSKELVPPAKLSRSLILFVRLLLLFLTNKMIWDLERTALIGYVKICVISSFSQSNLCYECNKEF